MPDRVIRRVNGPRGSALLAAGVVSGLHGAAYSPMVVPPSRLPLGLEVLTDVIPLAVYAALWAMAAVVAGVGGFRTRAGHQRDHWDAWGFGACVGMLTAWGTAYGAGWVLSFWHNDPAAERAWIAGGLYLGVAVILLSAARMTNRTPEEVRGR